MEATGERLVRLTFRGQYSEVTGSQTNPLEGAEGPQERDWSGLPLEVSTVRSQVVRPTPLEGVEATGERLVRLTFRCQYSEVTGIKATL